MGSCLSYDGGPASPPPPSGPKKGRRAGGGGGGGGGGGRRRRPEDSSARAADHRQQLHKIPGRMFLNGGSSVASLFTQQGKKGTNQDAMIVWENFASRIDTVFCGVFDGHGPCGHMVARRVRDSLPLKLSDHWEVNGGNDGLLRESSINAVGSLNSEETISLCLDDKLTDSINLEQKEKDPEIFSILKESFLKAFKVMDKELKFHPSIDCFCSGTTAVTLVKQGKNLVIGNCGDSRAVLGTRDINDHLIAVQLTVDLKPNLPKEEERIKQCKGRVFALRDEPDVARVWLPNYNSPGLAMARAFGDFCLKDFGLISVPEISYRCLTEKDEFVVLASDGVWDVLSNKEVVDIVASAPSRSSAAQKLVESAVRAWRYNYPTSKIDDCAVVCLFLSDNSSDTTSTSINNISNNVNDSNKLNDLESSGTQEENKGKGKEMGGEFSNEHTFSGSESQPPLSPSDVNSPSVIEGDDWSALEGVSRANTLLTLPRFSVAGEKRSSGSKSKKIA